MKANNLRVSFNEKSEIELTLNLIGNKVDNLSLIENARLILSNNGILKFELKQDKQSRSLTQNAMAWSIVGQIASKMRISNQECYLRMIGLYGQREENIISVKSDAVFTLYRALDNYCIIVGTRIIEDEVYKDIAILIGSSEYNTYQMSIFIDGIISEAKELGIETLSLSEISLLKIN